MRLNPLVLTLLLSGILLSSCNQQKPQTKDEQITVTDPSVTAADTATLNSVMGNVAFSDIPTKPTGMVLTGMAEHRLVTVYKWKRKTKGAIERGSYYYSYDNDGETEMQEHFMPGLDILFGYNLLNIAHYNMTSGKLNYMFNRAALIKTLYFPSFEQDSLNKKPINRNYYLVSAYDEDTNKDTLINSKDLRHFYHFDADCNSKTELVPANYSVTRSQYDSQNDAMFLFARHDENKNGMVDTIEPLHIFWIDLKGPVAAKRLY